MCVGMGVGVVMGVCVSMGVGVVMGMGVCWWGCGYGCVC